MSKILERSARAKELTSWERGTRSWDMLEGVEVSQLAVRS
jgi:hypothetical protein